MEPDQASKSPDHSDTKQDQSNDSPPKKSLDCLHYLKDVQSYQLKMIAIRVSGLGRVRRGFFSDTSCLKTSLY